MKKRVLLIPFLILSIVFLSACGSKDLDVNKTKKDKFGTLSYEVPEDFSKESVDKIEDSSLTFSAYQYIYNKMGSNGKFDDACSLSFFSSKNDNAETIEEFANIFQAGKTGDKKTINGVDWYIVKDEIASNMVEYHYFAQDNNKTYYEMSYSDFGSGTTCEKALNRIENSLNFK